MTCFANNSSRQIVIKKMCGITMIDYRKYLPYLLFSCKRVSAIISINPHEQSFKERLILGYHKFICKACHNCQFVLYLPQ